MIVDVAIALCPNGDGDERMTRQLIEHMIEKADAGRDVGDARSIEVEADLDARFLGLAYDCALAHGDFFIPQPLWAALIASRAPLGHQNGARQRRMSRARSGTRGRAGFRREAKFD